MFVPLWLGVPALVLVLLLIAWLTLILRGRNPLPFPDVGSRIFTAATPAAKATIVDLLAQHGVRERFQANSSSVLRSIMWDGTIINYPDPTVMQRVGSATASIGLVADDPAAAAHAAAAFLQARGFSAEVVLDAGGRFYYAKDATLAASAFPRIHGQAAVTQFRALKSKFDPQGLLATDLSRRLGVLG